MKIRIRRGTAAEWAAADPVLDSGELGLITDTDQIVCGDGVTAYSGLTPAVTVAPDATTTTKGIVRLAGDLAGTAALPTVPGLAGKVPTTRSVIAGAGMTGGGDLSVDRTLAVAVGTTAGTVAAGDDSRITGAAQKASNLSDLASAATARTNLGLGGAAVLAVGTTAGTVAAGDDSRITGAAQKASNLSDLASAATARANLGLGGAAVLAVGTTAGTVMAGDDTRAVGSWVDDSASAILSASGGGFVKGSSTYSARHIQVGKLVTYAFKLIISTAGGFAAGTGTWLILLPVTAAAGLLSSGVVRINDSGTGLRVGALTMTDTTHMEMWISNISANAVDQAGPGTAWSTNDYIAGTITYEAA
jgi:hypothetical protein